MDSLILNAGINTLTNITQSPVIAKVFLAMLVSFSMSISSFFSIERVLYPANRSGFFLTDNTTTIKITAVSKPPNIRS